MLNNKGFAVSAVLYTTLIAFILFLAVVLSVFSSSSDLVRNANTDLINGSEFEAKQIILSDNSQYMKCVPLSQSNRNLGEYYWYDSPIIVKINSRYGTYYWPKDFSGDDATSNFLIAYNVSSDRKIKTSATDWKLTFTDQIDSSISTSVEINPNICD